MSDTLFEMPRPELDAARPSATTRAAPRMQRANRDQVPLPGEAPPVAAWRVRMGTPQATEIYKERAATAECVNAVARNRGPRQFLVRGIPKCLAVLTLFALAHNVMRAVDLLGTRA